MDQQPKQSSPLKWVAIGCIGLFVLIGCAFGGCMLMGGSAAMLAISAPADQTKAYLANLRARNYAGALAQMSSSYQATHPLATFQQSVEALPALTQQTDDTINNRSVNNGVATMSGTLTTPQGAVPVEVTLSSSGDIWSIDSVVVGGVPLQ